MMMKKKIKNRMIHLMMLMFLNHLLVKYHKIIIWDKVNMLVILQINWTMLLMKWLVPNLLMLVKLLRKKEKNNNNYEILNIIYILFIK
mmetsp:Transcript_17937/g.1584  ORF Transcript_17937/g.1584 Transcript_17937/m.1584 type:complete len:88 (+) Transcript_17937:407-670(+)